MTLHSNILLSVLFLFAAETALKAQDAAPRNEIGINLFLLSADIDHGLADLQYQAVPGIYYKRFIGQHGIRIATDYYQRSEFDQYGPFTTATNEKTGELRLGYERRFGERRLQSFVFVDAVYRYSKNTVLREGPYASIGPIVPVPPYTKAERHEYGGIGGIGLKYNFNRHFTLSYEMGFQAGAWRDNNLSFRTHQQGTLLRLMPVRSLALSIRF